MENGKILLTGMKGELNKWREITFSQVQRFSNVTMSFLLKLISSFSATPIPNAAVLTAEMDKGTLRFI